MDTSMNSPALRRKRLHKPCGRHGQLAHAHTGRMVDRVGDRAGGRNDRHLANTSHAKRMASIRDLHQLRAARTPDKIRVEPVAFYLNLLRYPFKHERGWRVLALGGLLAVSQVANALGFFYECFPTGFPSERR